MKAWLLTLLGLALLLALAEGYKQLAWVRWDSDKGVAVFSNGAKVVDSIKPGQFAAFRDGSYKALPQWRPPQDIELTWTSQSFRRAVFSHERHFAAIGVKHCETCHADDKGLGKNTPWPSLAPSPDLEPHKATSIGRFCSSCHNGVKSASQIDVSNPPIQTRIFSAFGKAGDSTCDRCHAPASHGADFTAIHGEFAQDGAQCTSCHRGGANISPQMLGQALAFVQAQLKLTQNSEDTAAFQKTLPNHFCTYCHAPDRELWQEK